jgi:hypothetical protein
MFSGNDRSHAPLVHTVRHRVGIGVTHRGDSGVWKIRATLPGMAQVATTYPTQWPPRQGESLAGQTATVVQRDGTRKQIRFGRDVRLRREGARPPGTTAALQPVVEGHLDTGDTAFNTEDHQLILSDGSVFRITFSYQTFFFAVEPLSSRVRLHS